MQIAFFGSSLTSAYWNGAATYYRGIIRALHGRGYRITFYEPNAYERQAHRDLPDPEWARVVVYTAERESELDCWIEEARKADVIVKASGIGVFDSYLESIVPNIVRRDSLAVFWDVDAPATLDGIDRNPHDAFRSLIPKYDMILTYGGGDPVVQKYESFGARLCVPVYNALDPDTHFHVKADRRFTGALGFLGNRLPDRETRVREFLFRPAEQLPDRTFVFGGNGWQGEWMPSNVQYVGHVYTADHNAFNCSCDTVLNISRESMARYGYSPATRVFEAAGAGACIITDHWEGIERFLDPGREVLVARNGADVVEHLRHFTREAACEIGQAARRRVLAEHTYETRAKQVEAVFDGTTIRTR